MLQADAGDSQQQGESGSGLSLWNTEIFQKNKEKSAQNPCMPQQLWTSSAWEQNQLHS